MDSQRCSIDRAMVEEVACTVAVAGGRRAELDDRAFAHPEMHNSIDFTSSR